MRPRVMFIAVGALASCAASSSADTISYTESFSISDVSFDPLAISLPQFDPSLGTLSGVTLSIESFFSGSYIHENQDATRTSSAVLQRDWAHLIQMDDGAGEPGDLVLSTFDEWTGTGEAGVADGNFDFGGTGGYTIEFDGYDSDSFVYSDISGFTGVGSVSYFYDFESFFNYEVTGTTNFTMGALTSSTGDLTVMYDYVPVPAPASALTIALGGVIFSRRRTR